MSINVIPEKVIKEVEAIIDEEDKDFPKGMGYCHRFWYRKKQLLAERGYQWKSPAEENPNVIFD